MSAVPAAFGRKTFADIPQHDHPATYSPELTEAFIAAIAGLEILGDQFAGTGRIHRLAELAGVPTSIGVELEREWSNADIFTALPRLQIVGNSLYLEELLALYAPGIRTLSWLVSPTYATRMADHHVAKDPCKVCVGTGLLGDNKCGKCRGKGLSRRNTYTHRLGRPLSADNAGAMQWGEAYRQLHQQVWARSVALMGRDDRFVLNVKDHIRKHVVVPVTDWHIQTLKSFGLVVVAHEKVDCPGNRDGANGAARIEYESVVTLVRAA